MGSNTCRKGPYLRRWIKFRNRHHMSTQAAWAFVIVLQCEGIDKPTWYFYAATASSLSRASMNRNSFYGVGELELDPLSSEATGMVMVLSWISQTPFSCKHIVHYDNNTIGNFAAGCSRWQAGWEHTYLHSNISALRHCLQIAGPEIDYRHVKSHEGQPINEVVDALAKAVAKQIFLTPDLPVEVSQVMHNRYFKFSWMTLADSSTIPKPSALAGLFKAEGPFSTNRVDPTWWHPTTEQHTADVTVQIQAASANVLTLSPGTKVKQLKGLLQQGRISTLQQQFEQVATQIIGLQECRTQMPVTRHSPTHWVYQSGAAPDGSRGCELWLSKSKPYASSVRQQFFFEDSHVHIVARNDRMLFALVQAPHFHCRILVVHAPHKASKDVHCQDWWDQLRTLILRHQHQLPIIVLGDMNARIGSVLSEAVQQQGAELENTTGQMLHNLMLDCQLWAPSTFPQHHQGPDETWTSSEGIKARLDFVLLPDTWKLFNIQSYIQQEVDLCTVRDDHEVVCVKVTMSIQHSTANKTHKITLDPKKYADEASKQKFRQYLCQPPPVPWETGVGLHTEIVTEWLQQGALACFPKSRRQPKQRYVSDTTWQIISIRKLLKQLTRKSEMHLRMLCLRQCFDQWVHMTRQHEMPANTDLLPVLAEDASAEPSASCTEHHMIMYRLQVQCQHVIAWSIFHRHQYHAVARHASKQDRVATATAVAESFLASAQGHDSKSIYRSLKPLLGQSNRRKLCQHRPIPAVRMPDNSLAKDAQQAALRWQGHFAEAEQGHLSTTEQLQHDAIQNQIVYNQDELQFDLTCVPNLLDIENYIAKAKTGKSPGIDGLPSEIYRMDIKRMAQILWPIMAKSALRCAEPMRWRGGEICALPKTPQAGHQVEHFRSILLADFSSKACHGMTRSRLIPAIQAYRHNMQAGGIPGLGTDMLHLFVQSFAQLCRHQGVSSASLFVDIKQAFYRACRPLLSLRFVSNEALAAFFQSNGWNPDMYHEFQSRMTSTSALAEASVSSHQSAQIDAMLSTTWFQLRGQPQTMTHTTCGTRPGDSIADMLYTFIMARFLHSLRAQFIEHGLSSSFELKWTPPAPIQPGDFETQHIVQACWVDDLVLLLQDADPLTLIDKISQAIAMTQDLAAEYGLRLNYGPDKTAVLLSLHGPKRNEIMSALLNTDSSRPSIPFRCKSLLEAASLDIVPTYIYLGQLQDQKGHPGSEIHRRFTVIRPAQRTLKQNIFKSPKMPYRTKALLHQALVMSKLLYGAGAWQTPHIQSLKIWHRQLMQQYSSIAPTLQRGPGVYHLDILADCRMPHPLMTLAHQRFNLFDRLVNTELVELFALLQHQPDESSWFQLILQDLRRLQEICPDHAIFAISQQYDAEQLARHSAHNRKALTRLSKWGQDIYRAHLNIWKQFRAFQQHMDADALAFAVSWTQREQPAPSEGNHPCPHCDRSFTSYHGLCTHVFKKHGIHNIVQRYATSNGCRACLKVYHSRAQVLHHLRYVRTGCLARLLVTVAPLSDQDLEACLVEERALQATRRKQEREKTHKYPVQQGHGPLRPWPWQRAHVLSKQDSRDLTPLRPEVLESWLDDVLQSAQASDLAALYDKLMMQPYHGYLAQEAIHRFAQSQRIQTPQDLEPQLLLQTAITLWQDSHGAPPTQQLQPLDPQHVCNIIQEVRTAQIPVQHNEFPVQIRRQLAVDQLWLESSVQWQIRVQLAAERKKVWNFPLVVPRPVVQFPIYLYVFSGRRRHGDYQAQVERLLATHSMTGQVLLLDLALSDKHDVGQPSLVKTILGWLDSGAVSALLVAPPCETWSEARWIEPREEHDPRPVRTGEDPLGKAQTTKAELAQLTIANYLLYVAIMLMFRAAMTGIPSIMEHPKEPNKPSRPTIWKLPWIVALEQAGLLRKCLIWQAHYGSTAPKPTHLGIAHLPCFDRVMAKHRRQVDWTALQRLGGKDATGQWKTASAKEYPAAMNLALADLHVTEVKRRQSEVTSTISLPAGVQSQFDALYAGHEDFQEQLMQPDYHRNVARKEELD